MRIEKGDPILIIGQSPTALMVASALKHAEYEDVRIFIRENEINWPDAAFHLGAHLLPLLGEWGILDQVKKEAIPWEQAGLKWYDGKEVRDIDLNRIKEQTGYPPHVISSEAFKKVFLDYLPASWFRTGMEFISFTQNERQVQAHFLNGESDTGSLLVGADGSDSRVRLQMFGELDRQRESLITWDAIMDTSKLAEADKEQIHKPSLEFFGPGKRVSILPLSENQAGVSFTLKTDSNLDPREAKEQLKAEFENWPSPVPSLVEQLWPSQLVPKVHEDKEKAKQVFRGRVVLVGQAAQPIMPFMGLEDSFGIETGISLVREIHNQPKKLEKAFLQYEKRFRQRAKIYHRAGRKYANWLSITNPIRYTLRNIVFQHLPESVTTGPFYKINEGK